MQNVAASLVPVIAEPVQLNRPTVTLTRRGTVALALIRLGDALRDLNDSDRAYIVSMLRELLEDAGA